MTQGLKTRASFASEGTFSPDELVVRLDHGAKRTVLSGEGLVARGTVMGKVNTGAATSAAKAGGNTGNGAMGAITVAQPEKVGVYKVRFTAATVYQVMDPDGNVIGGNGATGTVFTDDLSFTITAGGTPFVAGDGFDITVAAGSGKLRVSKTASTDGSQIPYCVQLEDVDATSADADAMELLIGEVNSNGLTYGTGHSLATIYDTFRNAGIELVTAMPW